jgi:hypothetical protein
MKSGSNRLETDILGFDATGFAGDVLKLPDSCRFESGGLGGWILFKKDSYSCLFSYS